MILLIQVTFKINVFQISVFYQDIKKKAAIALHCQKKIRGKCLHVLVTSLIYSFKKIKFTR